MLKSAYFFIIFYTFLYENTRLNKIDTMDIGTSADFLYIDKILYIANSISKLTIYLIIIVNKYDVFVLSVMPSVKTLLVIFLDT